MAEIDTERAGAILHEQVTGVIEAAKAAEQNRVRAEESAEVMVGALRALETELASLLDEVRREAAALERSLFVERPIEPEPEPEPDPEPSPPEQADAAAAEESDAPETELDAQAQQSVVEKSDLELAELHQIAADKVDADTDEGSDYWRALRDATVSEAVKRKDFGASASDDDVPWLERRRRVKALRPLVSARERAMQAERQDDAG